MVRVGAIKAYDFTSFHLHPPHPRPLPRGEREFPGGNYLEIARKDFLFFPKILLEPFSFS
jgi:hypothetical protein